MTTVNVPESVKSALQSAADMAEGAFSTTLPGLAHTFHHDHQRQPADPSHRNANPEGEHTRKSTAPKDLGEFMVTQLEGKIDNDRLAKQFPTREGMWHGFIDWENNPDKKKQAAEILEGYTWTPIPEFQLKPLPSTNPILIGHRWKEYHMALGPHLRDVPEESWKIFKEEKRQNMLVVLDFPMNCEPQRDDLMKSHITPNDIHFVRNHGGIPTITNLDKYSIQIGGLVRNPGELLFKDLIDPSKFPQEKMNITLQCSGTRRMEQIALYPGEGDDATSVPYRKVKHEEALLAYEMNGVPLPRIHGGPLRLVVPGVIGARCTKWVTNLNLLPEPSMGPVQRQEYLYYPQQVGKHNVTPDKGFSIQDMPVSSAILSPKDKEVVVHDGYVHCEGWAYSGGGQWVERVEVSIDGGFLWHEVPFENMSPKHYYTMRLWKLNLPVPVEGWVELVVRAWNSAINTQPTIIRNAWNWTLHVTSSAHRVPIYSVNRSLSETAARLRLLEGVGQSIEPITFPIEVPVQSEEEYRAALAKKGPREPLD
ncbi:hypothetical protein NliqN6_0196 [Naganishia liquefaciens]|uniref:Sulfite oxidase n=1 Tax=Naganishia liquefaciens TaxID=104408 RepID=A0A8H3TP71_9TREE|nr:hypothetical protein NliqN6_0196 [Naganishia liquefaciens]